MWQKILAFAQTRLGKLCAILIAVLWFATIFALIEDERLLSRSGDESVDMSETESGNSDCNVVGVVVHGEIVTYNSEDAYSDQGNLMYDQTSADGVMYDIRQAEMDDDVKAILVEIDSYGGSGVAGEEIMRELQQANKPVIAFIRKVAVSAGYLAATGADTIFASKFSDIGSIGMTMSYLQNTEKNAKEGVEFIDLSSGIYKNSGSPDKPLTENERALFMRDITIGADYFISLVAKNRRMDIEKVRALADGSSMMGEQALKEGLIDKIGTYQDAEIYLEQLLGTPVSICW